MPRARRGVSGVVAAVFMLLVAALFIAYTISAIRSLRSSAEVLNAVSTEALSDRAAIGALNATYALREDAIVVRVESSNPFAVLVTGVVVVYDDHVKLYSRNSSPPLAVYACVKGTCTPRKPRLPVAVPAGGEVYIVVPREKSGVRAVALAVVPSTSPVVLPASPTG